MLIQWRKWPCVGEMGAGFPGTQISRLSAKRPLGKAAPADCWALSLHHPFRGRSFGLRYSSRRLATVRTTFRGPLGVFTLKLFLLPTLPIVCALKPPWGACSAGGHSGPSEVREWSCQLQTFPILFNRLPCLPNHLPQIQVILRHLSSFSAFSNDLKPFLKNCKTTLECHFKEAN